MFVFKHNGKQNTYNKRISSKNKPNIQKPGFSKIADVDTVPS
jgi:hypothetical protein